MLGCGPETAKAVVDAVRSRFESTAAQFFGKLNQRTPMSDLRRRRFALRAE